MKKDELNSIIDSAPADVGVAGAPPPVEAGFSAAEEWASCWAALGMLLGGILPEVREAFNEPAAKAWGAAMVPVAAKYGWTVSAIGPELALAMASAPGVLAVGVAISRRKSAAKDSARTSSPGDASKVRADPNASPMVRPA